MLYNQVAAMNINWESYFATLEVESMPIVYGKLVHNSWRSPQFHLWSNSCTCLKLSLSWAFLCCFQMIMSSRR